MLIRPGTRNGWLKTAFPILAPELAARVREEALDNYLADNLNAWELRADGGYRKIAAAEGEAPFSAQLSSLDGLYA